MPTTADLLALDPHALRDPWPVFAGWRAQGPVARIAPLGAWAVTDAALARGVLLDAATWSSDAVDGPRPAQYARWLKELRAEEPELDALLAVPLQTLLALDPPDHTRLRRVMTPWFSAAAIARLRPLVEDLVAGLLDPLLTGAPVDFVAAYADVLPLHTVATLLGLPRERWDELAAVAARASTSNPHLETKATLRARLWAELELLRYFDGRLRAPDGDAQGLVPGLAAAVAGGRITQREAIGLCREVLVAGAESTGNHLASALLLLARDPTLTRRVAADAAALDAFVEEALRLEPAFTGFWRRARVATELGGVALPAGALLLIPFAALNRDPAAFAAPDRVDLDRPAPRRHLAFSHGIHFCIGAPLVRLQSTATFAHLLERVERIELLADPAALAYAPSIQDRALSALPVRLVDRGWQEE